MDMDRRDGEVWVWWQDRYALTEDEEATYELPPDLMMSEERAHWFVIEMLRGPIGHQGPMGMKGTFESHTHPHRHDQFGDFIDKM